MSFSTILHKRNPTQGVVPSMSALSTGEIAINTADGKFFTKTVSNEVKTFLNSEQIPFNLNQSLSSVNYQYGENSVDGVLSVILGGVNNNVSGAGSTIINGSDNTISGDYAFIGNGSNNTITVQADFGAIVGGQNNTLSHPETFILGSNISSHLSGFTYVNNLSVIGKIYGDGSNLMGVTGGGGGDENVNTLVKASSASWDIIGDRYLTTSISTNSINKGTKVFAVSAGLSYIPTQDMTVVYDHDVNRHMHGTVLDYNSVTGSLTADITSHTGTGTYSDWRINIGGTPTFVDSLVVSNNLSDVANPSTALANLSGVSKTELASLSTNWQNAYTDVQSNSANWHAAYNIGTAYSLASSTFLTSETDSQTLSFNETTKALSISNGNVVSLSALVDATGQDNEVRSLSSNWQSTYTTVQTNSANWNYQGTDLKALSGSWQNALTTVQTNSASWSAPSSFTKKFDMVYSPSTISYSGTAPSGSLTSQSVWTIIRITYSTDGTVSAQGTALSGIWDNRSSLSYI